MRRRDWHKRLTEMVSNSRGRVPGPGWDGFMMVAEAVQIMTDVDIAEGVRGYSSQEEALEKMRLAGFSSPESLIAHYLPTAERPKSGDVVVLEGGALGIWQGTLAYVCGPAGLGIADPGTRILRTYRV